MPLFPLFIDLSEKKVLVVGGGDVATRKVKSLLPFTKKITVVAPKVGKELLGIVREEKLTLRKRPFLTKDLRGIDLVIVAGGSQCFQKRVFELCKKRGIPCNTVDSPRYCSFIFPSLVVKGELVIGISTSGKLPALSKRIRERVERCLPEDVENLLKRLGERREKLPKGKRRQKYIKMLVEEAIPIS